MNTSIHIMKFGRTNQPQVDHHRGQHRRTSVAAAGGLRLLVLLAVLCSPVANRRSHAADFTAPSQLRKQLYYAEADVSGCYPKTNAAFRYRELLYVREAGKVRADFTNIASFYGTAERQRAAQVEDFVWGKLNFSSTNDPAFGTLLLDVYYDRAAAEAILAQNLLGEAKHLHYGPPLAPPAPANGFYIDNEIAPYVNVVAVYRAALSNYFTLFSRTRTMLNPPNLPVTDNPGTKIFKSLVPSRGLLPATYQSNGSPVSVTGNNNPLFSGYKDLVFVNGLLRDYGRVAETLARLYLARATASDLAAAKALVTDAERTVYFHGNLLRGLFPNLNATTVTGSGLAESQAGWEKALSTLDQLRQLLDGKANLLGFAPDFLMLIGKQAGNFDSFDSFKSLLNPGSGQSGLNLANVALANARSSYASYRGFQDQLQTQLDDITGTAEDRLFQIVGDYPPYPVDFAPLVGSEADQQQKSIANALLQIKRNDVEISNLKQELLIEGERISEQLGKRNGIAQLQISYGNKQASLTEWIGLISAAQAAANELAAEAEAAGELNLGGTAGHGVNALAQYAAEIGKSQLAAQKERLAAAEASDITTKEGEALSVDSKAFIKTKMLELNKLAIDTQEAALQLAQEQGRLVALAREKANLEATIAESDSSLSGRYFADPVHRLAAQYALVQADLQFAEAQKWLFFMVRALEYKWNEPFSKTYASRNYNTASIFKLRNADELAGFY